MISKIQLMIESQSNKHDDDDRKPKTPADRNNVYHVISHFNTMNSDAMRVKTSLFDMKATFYYIYDAYGALLKARSSS